LGFGELHSGIVTGNVKCRHLIGFALRCRSPFGRFPPIRNSASAKFSVTGNGNSAPKTDLQGTS
jgi:hypothetical protein